MAASSPSPLQGAVKPPSPVPVELRIKIDPKSAAADASEPSRPSTINLLDALKTLPQESIQTLLDGNQSVDCLTLKQNDNDTTNIDFIQDDVTYSAANVPSETVTLRLETANSPLDSSQGAAEQPPA